MATIYDYIDDIFNQSYTRLNRIAQPATTRDDIVEKSDRFEVVLELPGVKKENIEITVNHGKLIVKAEKKASVEESDKVIASRRLYGTVEKNYTLGEEIDDDRVDASYSDGVLTISLQKKEIAKPKKVDIK